MQLRAKFHEGIPMKMKIAAFIIAMCAYAFHAYCTADSASNQFIKIYIQNIKNNSQDNCMLERIVAPAQETVSLAKPVEIPYISIRKYLREYASKKAYTPEEALKIATPQGLYRLWASESGVMCARDPRENTVSFNWKAKTVLENIHQRLTGKKTYLTLALAVLKNKLKVSLEPAQ